MILNNENQFFNIFNTNGRRADVIEAYRIYLEILQDLAEENHTNFDSYPSALTQFRFYQEAINRSPDVFKTHTKYDKFMENIKGNYEKCFWVMDGEGFSNLEHGNELLDILDKDIEARARHYTSNLVKIGFVNNDRSITEAGHSFVNATEVQRDSFEQMLPLKNSNLIFLRQLMKLRAYTKEKDKYYSPMFFVLYLLTKYDRLSTNDFKIMTQLISPYRQMDSVMLDAYTDVGLNGKKGDIISYYLKSTENEYDGTEDELAEDIFKSIYTNRKSQKIADKYYRFYKLVISYKKNHDEASYIALSTFYSQNKSNIDSAFGYGVSLFNLLGVSDYKSFDNKNKDNIFLNAKLFELNGVFYEEFQKTKTYINILEYSDTLMRLLGVSGIIQQNNGIVTLKNREVWLIVNNVVNFKNYIFGRSTEAEHRFYEEQKNSWFGRNEPMSSIWGLSETQEREVTDQIKVLLGVQTIKEGHKELKDKVNKEFIKFIKNKYPVEKVIKLLTLFKNRENDSSIRKETDSEASIPTIFEYVCGIALFYISDDYYDVFDSFNLTMSADYIPETHAGGGDGDIIARYQEKTVMLEVTLMNKQAQKRGEWEPVLRHSANLVIDESPKKVYTLFIADEFDDNTINIWRAVASVPLKPSRGTRTDGLVAENVKILPVSCNEFSKILDTKIRVSTICSSIDNSFEPLVEKFDVNWRNKIIESIVANNP